MLVRTLAALSVDAAVQLHHVADYYEVLQLRDACCNFLLEALQKDNCCDLLRAPDDRVSVGALTLQWV